MTIIYSATIEDIAEPGVEAMLDDNEDYEEIVRVVAMGVLDHKKWRKPARKIVNKILIKLAKKGKK